MPLLSGKSSHRKAHAMSVDYSALQAAGQTPDQLGAPPPASVAAGASTSEFHDIKLRPTHYTDPHAVLDSIRSKDWTRFDVKVGLEMSVAQLEQQPARKKSGWLQKRGGGKKSKAFKKRWCILVGDHLFYFKSNSGKKPQGAIANLSAHAIQTEEFSIEFKVSPADGGRSYDLKAQSLEDKNTWIRTLPAAADSRTLELEQKLQRQSFVIDAADLTWSDDSQLGKGASGVVRKAIWQGTTPVAVKVLNNLPEFINPDAMREFFQEICTLADLRHPCIVSMFGYAKKDDMLALVTEYVDGGDLSSAIHGDGKNPAFPLSSHLKATLLKNVSQGMVYLHKKNVVHRDLKPGNILVSNLIQGTVKVCDFGLSGVVTPKTSARGTQRVSASDAGTTTGAFGSPSYAAPEIGNADHTPAVDVYSFGIIMWELWTRTKPWQGIQGGGGFAVVVAVSEGKRPDIAAIKVSSPAPGPANAQYTSQVKDLMQVCWAGEPSTRPKFSDVFARLDAMLQELPSDQEILMKEAGIATSEAVAGQFSVYGPASLPLHDAITRGVFRGEQTMPFEQWRDSVIPLMFGPGTPADRLDSIKLLLVTKGPLQFDNLRKLVSWFTPLVRDDDPAPAPDAWKVSDFMAVIDEISFAGFASAQESKEWLLRRPVGSYLFRFSSQVGVLTISASWEVGAVGHWRITTAVENGRPIFNMNNLNYTSLADFVAKHNDVSGVALSAKDTVGSKNQFFLVNAISKREMFVEREATYQE